MLSDEEIDVAHVKFAWVNLNCTEHRDAFARAIESAATAPLLARIAEQDALIGNLRLEAQIQAQEARTANASIAEIYQAVTGGTGEPGNWHGAAPVKARIAELTRELEEARKDAIPAMRAYAAKNPRFVSNEDVVQDPLGVHAWLEKHGAATKEQT